MVCDGIRTSSFCNYEEDKSIKGADPQTKHTDSCDHQSHVVLVGKTERYGENHNEVIAARKQTSELAEPSTTMVVNYSKSASVLKETSRKELL